MSTTMHSNHTPKSLSMTGFRFENFFVDRLVEDGKIDTRTSVATRYQLAVGAIREAEVVGFLADVSVVERRLPEGVPFCHSPDSLFASARVLLMDSLLANGFLDEQAWYSWRNVAQIADLGEVVSTLLRQIVRRDNKISQDAVVEIMDHTFLGTVGVTNAVPGTDFEMLRKERPKDPMCIMAAVPLRSYRARMIAREVLIFAKLHQHGLLKDEQITAIYDVCYCNLTGYRGVDDLTHLGGSHITAHLNLPATKRVSLWADAVASLNSSDLKDSPFADHIGLSTTETPMARLVQRYPLAANLTRAFVEHKIWNKKFATSTWERLPAMLSAQ